MKTPKEFSVEYRYFELFGPVQFVLKQRRFDRPIIISPFQEIIFGHNSTGHYLIDEICGSDAVALRFW